jgi:hypothetical protein
LRHRLYREARMQAESGGEPPLSKAMTPAAGFAAGGLSRRLLRSWTGMVRFGQVVHRP